MAPERRNQIDQLVESALEREAGLTLGHYKIESRIGAGGMGVVFLARDERLGRKVALKLLAASNVADRQRVLRFEQEARAASALNHPNILTIYEVGEFAGNPFIATEYVEGQTLRSRLAAGPVRLDEALAIAAQAASALAAAHAAGVVHRDVKPENLMLRPDGFVKVLDFGIAKLVEQPDLLGGSGHEIDTAVRTGDGVRLGTTPYMSPEQARGLDVDARTDVWSLGVVLYEMLAGDSPFEGPTTSDTIAAILSRDPAPIAHLLPEAAGEIARMLRLALAKPLEGRYGSMQHLADDLARLKVDLEVAVRGRGGLWPEPPAKPTGVGTAGATAEGVQATGASPPTNLPEAMTSFVGRAADIAAIVDALGESRLLTLTGEGGIGKTRLAIEVASAARHAYPDGVWLVELAGLSDAALVPQMVASALGLREQTAHSPLPNLCEQLRAERALLVLDNCEHLVEACTGVASALLRTCPRLRILATSREALGVTGERLWEVQPLSLPDRDGPASLERLGDSEAARLFVERAKLVVPGFALTEENAPVVAGLCRRLEGIALAIELAASKVRVLSPEQILERLDDRLGLLVGGDRSAQPRQRTMRATLAWGYDLLSEREAVLLRRLSIYAGGWSLDMAEAACGDGPDGAVARGGVLEVLARLVDKSLVRVSDREHGARYGMLDTIREYARERLDEAGEAGAVLARHFEWCLALAEQTETEGQWLKPTAATRRLALEEENVRVALRWAVEERNDPERGLRLAVLLWRLWLPTGRWSEGRAWLEAALAAAPDAPPPLRGKATRCLSALAQEQGDFAYARRLLEETLASQRERGETTEVFYTIFVLGRVVERMGDYERALAYQEEGLALARAAGDLHNVAAQLNTLGVSSMERGEYDRATSLFSESLDLFRSFDDGANVAVVLHNLGEIAFRRGDVAGAERLLDESLAIASAHRMTRLVAFSSHVLGNVAAAAGDFERAHALLSTAITTGRDEGDKDGIAYALEGMARLAALRGRPTRALELAGAASALRDAIGGRLPPFQQAELDRLLEASRAALGDERSAEALDRGARAPLDRAIDAALGDADGL